MKTAARALERGEFSQRLDSAEETLERQVARAAKDRRFIETHYRVLLDEFLREFFQSKSSWIWIDFSSWSTTLEIQFTATELSEVVPMLRWLANEGNLAILRRPTAADTQSKRWVLGPRGWFEEDIRVRLSLEVSAELCEQIQVGEKTVPIFETRCAWNVQEVVGAEEIIADAGSSAPS